MIRRPLLLPLSDMRGPQRISDISQKVHTVQRVRYTVSGEGSPIEVALRVDTAHGNSDVRSAAVDGTWWTIGFGTRCLRPAMLSSMPNIYPP